MPEDQSLDDWTARYLLDNAPEVMEYVLRGRRFGMTTLQGLRAEFAFALLRKAVADLTDAQLADFADLNTEFALRREQRPHAELPALCSLVARRKGALPTMSARMAAVVPPSPLDQH